MNDAMIDILLIVHAAATWFMVGLIWFVQVVHYPLMGVVGREGWLDYERRHQRLTTAVVGPAMLVEAATAIASALVLGGSVAWTGVGLLAVVWLSTWLLQVPQHRRLEAAFDDAVLQRLVRSNWIRTGAWSARGVIAMLMLASRDAGAPA